MLKSRPEALSASHERKLYHWPNSLLCPAVIEEEVKGIDEEEFFFENVKMEGLETKLREVNMENLVLKETVWSNEDCILDLETRFNSSKQALKVEKKKHNRSSRKL